MNRREAISKLVTLTAAAAIPIETLEAMLPVKESYTEIEIQCLGFEVTSRSPGVVTGKMSFLVNGELKHDLFDLPGLKYEHPGGGEVKLIGTGIHEEEREEEEAQ